MITIIRILMLISTVMIVMTKIVIFKISTLLLFLFSLLYSSSLEGTAEKILGFLHSPDYLSHSLKVHKRATSCLFSSESKIADLRIPFKSTCARRQYRNSYAYMKHLLRYTRIQYKDVLIHINVRVATNIPPPR